MPIIKRHNIDKDTEWGLWEIEEDISELIKPIGNIKSIDQITNLNSRRQKYAVRVLLKTMGYSYLINYSSSGKPNLLNYHISISHTNLYVAVIVSKTHNVAIDIESKLEKVDIIKKRFLHSSEYVLCSTPQKSGLMWSTKECYIKLHDSKSVNLSDIRIKSIDSSNIKLSYINKDNNISNYQYRIFENFWVVWAIQAFI